MVFKKNTVKDNRNGENNTSPSYYQFAMKTSTIGFINNIKFLSYSKI